MRFYCNNFFLNFGDFVTFLYWFKKILVLNYKKAQCYGNAWLFLFKMSHHTSLSVKYSGRSLNFPPAQLTFQISLSKACLAQAGGVHFGQTFSVRSLLLLTSDSTPYQTALLIIYQIHHRNNTECLPVKKKKNSGQYPLPNPPYMVETT